MIGVSRNLTRCVLGALALGLAVVGAQPASAAVYTYRLHDHPDGNKTPPYEYGLRMDGLDKFWSFGNGSDVTLVYDDVALTATIAGTAVQSLGGPGNFGSVWDLSYAMSGIVDQGGGFFTSTGGSGSISLGMTSFVLDGKQNGDGLAMQFLGDGHRLAGDTSSAVGRGWLDGSGTNDFLFTATAIPLPASAFLLLGALGGLGVLGRLRDAA